MHMGEPDADPAQFLTVVPTPFLNESDQRDSPQGATRGEVLPQCAAIRWGGLGIQLLEEQLVKFHCLKKLKIKSLF